jgi:Type II intron maturase/AI2M/AI1M-like, HNH endonuclease
VARFLGYEITVQRNQRMITRGRRSLTNAIALRVPSDVVKAACARYAAQGKPQRRTHLMNESDHTIVGVYGAAYRGIVQYYLLASDIRRLHRLNWVMVISLLKTLAGKHHSTVSKMARKYKATISTPYGPRRCVQATVDRGETRPPLVARFGGIPLRRQHNAVLTDRKPGRSTHPRGTQLIARLRRGRCEVCDEAEPVEVHHIRRLAELTNTCQPQPTWMTIMSRRRRKTLVVCRPCHDDIHTGQPTGTTAQYRE